MPLVGSGVSSGGGGAATVFLVLKLRPAGLGKLFSRGGPSLVSEFV